MAKSKQEADLDRALVEVFGPAAVKSEKTIRVRGKTLYVDRVIEAYKIAFEIDGRQHNEYVEHFHGDAQGFTDAQTRDRFKEQWLTANGYSLVRFNFDEAVTAQSVRDRLVAALNRDDGG
jgi:very-short-patch-repair endonuclease